MTYELCRVVPAQSGVEAQERGRGRGRGLRGHAGATQPHHVVDAQALNHLCGNLEAGYIYELGKKNKK